MTLHPKIHFANVFFENDLLLKTTSYAENLHSHPNFLQLQYLPLLYGKKEDFVAVSCLKSSNDPRCISYADIHQFPSLSYEFWGISESLCQFHLSDTQAKQLSLNRLLSSKLWTWQFVKNYLKDTILIQNLNDFHHFLKSPYFPCVIKSPDGFSARGHQLFFKKEDFNFLAIQTIESLLEKSPLIIEPWLERFFDFSTQWFFDDTGFVCLGTTLLSNNNRGGYCGNGFYPQDPLFIKNLPPLAHHFESVKPILEKIHLLGFRGNLGIDAFFYVVDQTIQLMPLIEINPRKTMGYVTIKIAENNRFESPVFLRLVDRRRCQLPLLPTEIIVNNQKILFKKNLEIQTDPGEYTNANHENPRWHSFKWNH